MLSLLLFSHSPKSRIFSDSPHCFSGPRQCEPTTVVFCCRSSRGSLSVSLGLPQQSNVFLREREIGTRKTEICLLTFACERVPVWTVWHS